MLPTANREVGKEYMKKKILFIIWSYTYGGGAEALLTTIANHLNPEKYDVSIIEYEHAEIKTEPVNSNIHVLPYIQAVETPEGYSKTYQLYHTPEVLINRYIKGDYDLYVSFNYQIPTFLLPKGTKNIAWIHSDVYDLADEKVIRERKRQDVAFDNVEKIVAISDITKKSIEDLFPNHADKLVEIYNGIDIDRVRREAEEKTAVSLKHPSILFVGRLEDRKDPARLVDVLKLVHEREMPAHLYYIGKGDVDREIIRKAGENGLSDFVHLEGYQQNPFPIMKQAGVVCLLSKSEGFSLCLLEGVALDRPFVATLIGGANELSNGQRCGRIIGTDAEAAEAICELVKCSRAEIQKECQKSVERFGLKQYIRQIEELFDSVIDEEP